MIERHPLWVDYHCHLDLFPDHGALAAECDRLRIATFAVTTTPKAWERNVRIAERFSMLRVGLGLHPQVVAERAQELPQLLEYLPATKYVGEIGLDASPRFYSSFPEQERVFRTVLEHCVSSMPKVFSIHSVRSAARVLQYLESILPRDHARIVLHWFTGSTADAQRALRLGCYFSVNSAMLASPRSRELVASLPRDRILTETDGPFVKIGNANARPTDIPRTVGMLAELIKVTPESAAQLVQQNLYALEMPLSHQASLLPGPNVREEVNPRPEASFESAKLRPETETK